MRRSLVVGDVHGCREELEALLAAAGFERGDRLVLVGDLVARGPDSQGVVQLAREAAALAVLGNHDDHLLRVRAGHPAKKKHHELARSLSEHDWAYLESLPVALELAELGAIVVHGGLLPGVPLADQPRELVMNLRSLDAAGRPSTRVDGGVAWASQWEGPTRVLFGHDALRGLQRHPHALGLDTGCVYGKRLTGVWLPDERVVQVPSKRVYVVPGGP